MEKDKSQLPSIHGDINNPPSPSTTMAFPDSCNEQLTREIQSNPQSADTMATPVTSTSTVEDIFRSSTAPNPGPSPTIVPTAGQEISPTSQPPPTEIPVHIPATGSAAKPATSSTPASSKSPPPTSLNTTTASLLSSASSLTTRSVLFPAAPPWTVSPTGSSSTTTPAFGSKPTGSYPFGPTKFAIRTPTVVPKPQMHTFGQPSAPTLTNSATNARPPVFGQPSGFSLATPRSNSQRNNATPSSLSGTPPAVISASSTLAASASSWFNNAPLESSPQAFSATVPAAPQPAIPASNVTSTATTPFSWPNPGTTAGSAAPETPSTADCTASMLVKQLQAQIQPLKQRTLLEGLLSHFTIPDTESLRDENKCHVCLESFLTGSSPELPIKLPCEHICGSVCILKWLAPQQTRPREKNCPICRKPIFGVECASEWNALTSLEKSMLGMAGKLQAMVTAPNKASNQSQSRGLAVKKPIETEMPVAWGDMPTAWGKGLFLQVNSGRDEMQWRAWTHFLEELVNYAESADEWSLWYFRRQLVIPIINMVTVLNFIEMKKKGYVWVYRVIGEVPELYLPLHPLLDRAYPGYYLATPGEEQHRRTADFHAKIEARGHCLWSCPTRPYRFDI